MTFLWTQVQAQVRNSNLMHLFCSEVCKCMNTHIWDIMQHFLRHHFPLPSVKIWTKLSETNSGKNRPRIGKRQICSVHVGRFCKIPTSASEIRLNAYARRHKILIFVKIKLGMVVTYILKQIQTRKSWKPAQGFQLLVFFLILWYLKYLWFAKVSVLIINFLSSFLK